jgi:hypothetical protein
MPVQSKDLWSLARNRQCVAPQELADAIEDQIVRGDLDFRSRLLIRDGMDGLESYWGRERLAAWLATCPVRAEIEAIRNDDLGEVGFPSLTRRIMEPTRPEHIKQFFRELGVRIPQPIHIVVGGSAALMLFGHLCRRTEGVDVVDEVPFVLRQGSQLLDELLKRYGLYLTAFQSHHLSRGWEQRTHTLEPFRQLRVALVDPYDIFLSKLFSAREKDQDDLHHLKPQLDKETLARRLCETTASLQADAALKQRAVENWYILYGEALPS